MSLYANVSGCPEYKQVVLYGERAGWAGIPRVGLLAGVKETAALLINGRMNP